MPIYEYQCLACGAISENLLMSSGEAPQCHDCGSENLEKMVSAHSSMSGPVTTKVPGPGDTPCCGSAQTHAGCAGPGSCCSKS
jgi:putative FmdB family regulatory protein